MCVAPAVQWYPLYGELFEDRVTDASRQTIERILKTTRMTPCLIPGGFSEATYTNADPEVEYSYIADRLGFIRIAIQQGVDIIPACKPASVPGYCSCTHLSHEHATPYATAFYPCSMPRPPPGGGFRSDTFGLNDMYATLDWRRHQRAVKAQASGLPTVLWSGCVPLSNVPFTEELHVVTFDPFPTSQYTQDQVAQAHTDYLDYLKRCFDSRKAECGAAHKRLEFIGKSKPPMPRSRL